MGRYFHIVYVRNIFIFIFLDTHNYQLLLNFILNNCMCVYINIYIYAITFSVYAQALIIFIVVFIFIRSNCWNAFKTLSNLPKPESTVQDQNVA